MRLAVGVSTALAIALSGGAALAAPPPPAATPASAASAAAPAAKLSPADQKRLAAIQQYQHDLVNVVALRAEPDYLLGAAILAESFKNLIPELEPAALSARAAAAPNAGPAVEWARLDVCKSDAECPNPDAFAFLKKHASTNAAVWLIALDVAAEKKDAAGELVALKQAAAAQTYDDYYGEALAGVAKATTVLPPLPDTTAGAHDGQPDTPDGVRVLIAVHATQDHLRPNLAPLLRLCGPDAAAKAQDTRAACLRLAHTLQWGSSPIGRAVGLRIQAGLDPADKAENDQASQNLAWQMQQYSALLQRALTDAPLASQWLALARTGGTELSLVLATLRANDIPIEAPVGAAPAASTGS
ncbi:MAG: hypothetical protein ACREPJ_13935 [Rhodanobacteraceae bacterium]